GGEELDLRQVRCGALHLPAAFVQQGRPFLLRIDGVELQFDSGYRLRMRANEFHKGVEIFLVQLFILLGMFGAIRLSVCRPGQAGRPWVSSARRAPAVRWRFAPEGCRRRKRSPRAGRKLRAPCSSAPNRRTSPRREEKEPPQLSRLANRRSSRPASLTTVLP